MRRESGIIMFFKGETERFERLTSTNHRAEYKASNHLLPTIWKNVDISLVKQISSG